MAVLAKAAVYGRIIISGPHVFMCLFEKIDIEFLQKSIIFLENHHRYRCLFRDKNSCAVFITHFEQSIVPLKLIRHPSHLITMPSRANPNVPNKMRRKSNRAKVQKARAGIAKNPRGTAASNVLHPTSGPLAPVSGKKARKLQKAQNHARQRALEQALQEQEEVDMTGE